MIRGRYITHALASITLVFCGIAHGDVIHDAVERGDIEGIKAALALGAGLEDVDEKTQRTPLIVAASSRESNAETVSFLLETGALVDGRSSDGKTPLIWAGALGDADRIRVLLENGADINAMDSNGMDALRWACGRYGDNERVQVLLDAGANPNLDSELASPPLLMAAGMGRTESVELLLKAGAIADVVTANNETALMAACGPGGKLAIVELLLKHEVDINRISNRGFSALMIASGYGDTAKIRVLVKAGADINIRGIYGRTPLMEAAGGAGMENVRTLLELGADVNILNGAGQNILADAVARGDTEMLSYFIDAGCDVNLKDTRSQTALMLAAVSHNSALVRLLIKNGADIKSSDERGWTALHEAARSGSTASIEALLEAGADVNARENTGAAPLALTTLVFPVMQEGVSPSTLGSVDAAQLLLANGADVSFVDEVGRSCLHYAAMFRNTKLCEVLIGAGGRVQLQDVGGLTALMTAAARPAMMQGFSVPGDGGVFELLIKHGAEMNGQDQSGKTPLIHAAEFADKARVESLLSLGADPTIADHDGLTAYDYVHLRDGKDPERYPILQLLKQISDD